MRSSTPANFEALVAKPARSDWLENSVASNPARRAYRLTNSATIERTQRVIICREQQATPWRIGGSDLDGNFTSPSGMPQPSGQPASRQYSTQLNRLSSQVVILLNSSVKCRFSYCSPEREKSRARPSISIVILNVPESTCRVRPILTRPFRLPLSNQRSSCLIMSHGCLSVMGCLLCGQ